MYPLIIFTGLLGPDCNYSMSVGAITNGFVDVTQHNHGIKYFSYLLQVASRKSRFGVYCEITFVRHNVDRNFVNSDCIL